MSLGHDEFSKSASSQDHQEPGVPYHNLRTPSTQPGEGPKSPHLELLDPRTQVIGHDTVEANRATATTISTIRQTGRPSGDSGRQKED